MAHRPSPPDRVAHVRPRGARRSQPGIPGSWAGALLAVAALIPGSWLPLAAMDRVILTNGQSIDGTLMAKADSIGLPDAGSGAEVSTADASDPMVSIRTGTGILRVRRSLIEGAELSYDSRRSQIKDDDGPGLVGLARWCLTQPNMQDKALALLKQADALPHASIEVKGLLAQVTDLNDGPDAALPLYRDYRDHGGTDPGILARLKALEDLVNGAFGVPATLAAAPTVTLLDNAPNPLISGWSAESPQWSNPVTVSVTTDGSPPVPAIKLVYDCDPKQAKDKAAVKHPLHISMSGPTAGIELWLKDIGTDTVSVALAVKTGNYVFHESLPIPVVPGNWQHVDIDLLAHTFKSAATNWINNGTVRDLGDIRELQILIYNGPKKGTMLIKGIHFQPSSL